ncbi:hypothetical protein HNY73_005255 [Argiope bruennichi]|uniref:Uncharacterized protein n=1 Tax=Argiope bruennichi TaxID=94029 RepID=A0A8T0FFX0_ARGBR|nr:hypothetical protein HNY73_005255 [Argiope bruennichi]
MAERDIDQNMEGEENAPLPEEQPAIPHVHADIFQMGDGPFRGRQDIEAGRRILRARRRHGRRFPAPNAIGGNAREPLRRGLEMRRGVQRGRNMPVGQQHGRGMQFHNDPRLGLGQGDGPAQPLEVNVPGMIEGQGDGILAHSNLINPPQRTRRSLTIFSIHGTALHQMRNTDGEGRYKDASSVDFKTQVIELIPEKDGPVRAVKLKTQSGTLIRPIQRVFPLEVSANDLMNSPLQKVQLSESSVNSPNSDSLKAKQPQVSRCGRAIKKLKSSYSASQREGKIL